MRRLLIVMALLTWAFPSDAATRTVKAAGGGDHTTIQACANVAVAGDICEVYAGTYNEDVSIVRSGTSEGARIAFMVHTGDTVVVTQFNVGSYRYITISGFEITGPSYGVYATGAHFLILQYNYIHYTGNLCVHLQTSEDVVIRHNTITGCGMRNLPADRGRPPIYVWGSRALIEDNDISDSSDGLNGLGSFSVVRNNQMHTFNADLINGAHIDGLQLYDDNTPSFLLIEGNVFQGCHDSAPVNCHFLLQQYTSDNIITRYNYVQDIDGEAAAAYGAGYLLQVTNVHHYNNTMAEGKPLSNQPGMCGADFYPGATSGGVVKNNICYNSMIGGYEPWGYASGIRASDGNLVYTTGYAGGWTGVYASESTYLALRNKDPQFANYPTDGTLMATSPARNAGVALTTVAVVDSGSGTSLIVGDARYFQPGWAGAQADELRIGASTTAQIASINYSTNAITLSSGVSRSDGDPVYLYKKSDGVIVLPAGNTTHDVGAFPYRSDAGPGTTDGGPGATDAGHDAGAPDGGYDGGVADAGHDAGTADAGHDGGVVDAGHDAGAFDAGQTDGGADGGATGDAGVVHDGGPLADGGAAGDAGTLPDGGSPDDGGGQPFDGGPNADGASIRPGDGEGLTGSCGCVGTPTGWPGLAWLAAIGLRAVRRSRRGRRRLIDAHLASDARRRVSF